MLGKKVGPYYHPDNRHEYKYWVRKYTHRPGIWLVSKDDPYNPTEYDVNLRRGQRMGRVCNCPHHTHRRVPCLHMKFAKEARETYELWEKAGWV